MKNITIIGTGYVGLVSGACFAEKGDQVICCDVNADKINQMIKGDFHHYEPGLDEIVSQNVKAGRLSFSTDIASSIRTAEIIFIAVGTPMTASGEPDLQYVHAAAQTIGENLDRYKVIVTKSTVPIGSGKALESIIKRFLNDTRIPFDVVSNPEFLREGSAIYDFLHTDRVVIGAERPKGAEMVSELYESFGTQLFVTSMENAEMIKYASNGFLATKVSYMNAIANICENVGADITEVAKGMGMDHRIGPHFLQAGIGYGGSCLPKDTHALVHIGKSVGYDFQLMKSVISTNEQQKMKVVDKLRDVLDHLEGNTITILGLSYKPNTSDMREAPSLQIIPKLLQEGANVNVYDPKALTEAKAHFGNQVMYYNNLYESVIQSDACVILTEWKQIVGMDLKLVYNLMRHPIIIDGRNCFSLDYMKDKHFIYHSIGRIGIQNAYASKILG